jgi:hypothetical protein
MNTPFLLPSTRMKDGLVAKSAKLQTCSPTTASVRSKTRWYLSRSATWYSSLNMPTSVACKPNLLVPFPQASAGWSASNVRTTSATASGVRASVSMVAVATWW